MTLIWYVPLSSCNHYKQFAYRGHSITTWSVEFTLGHVNPLLLEMYFFKTSAMPTPTKVGHFHPKCPKLNGLDFQHLDK